MPRTREMTPHRDLPIIPYTLSQRIKSALLMDQGLLGDVTSQAVVEKDRFAHARFVVKAKTGIISGLTVVHEVFRLENSAIMMTDCIQDGSRVEKGDIVAVVDGPARGILTAERTALDIIQHMSGIATKTRSFVDALAGTNTIILDTRKVTPGWGDLDKEAVRHGGAQNHRMDLSSMGLIKNNHIDLLGGDMSLAIQKFRMCYPGIPLEVEVRNCDELKVALQQSPDRILLDNMTIDQIRSAVITRDAHEKITGKRIPLEASGNMTLDRVRTVAQTNVDFISVGSLTHSVTALDISLHVVSDR